MDFVCSWEVRKWLPCEHKWNKPLQQFQFQTIFKVSGDEDVKPNGQTATHLSADILLCHICLCVWRRWAEHFISLNDFQESMKEHFE